MDRKDIVEYFPYEEQKLKEFQKPFTVIQSKLNEIMKIITGKDRKINTGYGFSQSEGQEKIIKARYDSNLQ